MIKFNPVGNRNLSFGDILVHRSGNWKAVVLWKDMREVKDISFYLFGWMYAYIPEKEEVVYLIKIQNGNECLISETKESICNDFAYRGKRYTNQDFAELLARHEQMLAEKNLISICTLEA